MSDRDSSDDRATELFVAARRERASDAARSRALASVLSAATGGHVEGVEDHAGTDGSTRAVRLGKGVVYGVAMATMLAAAAGVVLLLQGNRADLTLFPSPERAEIGSAARSSSGAEPEAPPSAVAPITGSGSPSNSATTTSFQAKSSAGRVRDAGAHPRSLSLDEEVNALEEARTALSAGDATRALERIAHYQNVLHGTRLTAEATLLKIQALAQSGRRSEAARMARAFIEENPGNPLVDRARSYAEEASNSSALGVPRRGSLP